MTELPLRTNVPELSVSELAHGVQRTLEDSYARVRVRGEICNAKLAASGHLYAGLKDENACVDIVCWRSTAARLKIRPEDGLDVICTGKITTYPKSSRYQLIVESIELAGEGALLKMLEDRRKRLAAEGLFDAARKRPLPFLPDIIGVVTSPTGAVIRDILHRLDDRFPRHVIVWPVAVQGDGAAAQVAGAIAGFNAMTRNRPDLLIVARGGGSLEDLMAFNEENVVRAAAESRIPLISAVGHETDTTLIDYAADRRAPTPTAAAEMAVPVRRDLVLRMMDDGRRLYSFTTRGLALMEQRMHTLSAKLGDPRQTLNLKGQRLDHLAHKLTAGFETFVERKAARTSQLAAMLRHPQQVVQAADRTLSIWDHRLQGLGPRLTEGHRQSLARTGTSFEALPERLLSGKRQAWEKTGALLEAYSYHNALERGFAVIRSGDGTLVSKAKMTETGQNVTIEFKDGRRNAQIQ